MPYKNSRRDRVLENVSIDYRPEGFVCKDVLTPLPVNRFSGYFGKYGNAHLRLLATRVKDRGQYAVAPTFEYQITDQYRVHTHGIKDFITERDVKEVEQPFEVESDVVSGLKLLLMIEKEYAISQMLTTAANYNAGNTITLAAAAKFSNYGSNASDPVKAINDAKTAIWQKTGVMANTIIIGWDTLEILRSHPKLANVYGNRGVMTKISVDQLRTALGIQNIVVASAQYVTDANSQTAFWGKDIVVCNRQPRAMKHQRTFGYYLTLRGMEERVFVKDQDDPPNSRRVLSDMTYDFMITNKDCGYLIKGAIA